MTATQEEGGSILFGNHFLHNHAALRWEPIDRADRATTSTGGEYPSRSLLKPSLPDSKPRAPPQSDRPAIRCESRAGDCGLFFAWTVLDDLHLLPHAAFSADDLPAVSRSHPGAKAKLANTLTF